MKTFKYSLIIFIISALLVIVIPSVFAEDGVSNVLQNLVGTGSPAYGTDNLGDNGISLIVGQIIQTVLSYLGVIFVILIIWSGFQWMTAGGNAETITKAKQRIINATIGLAIALTAYIITHFIISQLLDITEGPITLITSLYA